jgi:two-component system response regulator HydG
MTTRILVVEDDAAMSAVITEELRRRGFETRTLASADEAFAILNELDFEILITDLTMRGMNGIELCDRVVANRPDIPVIVVTGFGSMETAIATLRAGAFDFLTKPFDMDELLLIVDRAVAHRELREEVKRLRKAVANQKGISELIGHSRQMQHVFDLIARVAETDASVLITGETGVGKELVARAIHDRSRRGAGPMVTINCAAMPEPLLESELFGHVRGAFTDAHAERRGLFVEASGGTLFLDELGEMPMTMQAKLLRALEARCVRPIGGNAEQPFDVRVITATNQDLAQRIEEGLFREDLFYRVNVVQVEVPPLRSRGTDALALAQAFTVQFAAQHGKAVRGVSPGAAERILNYSWPGNVRELRNSIERAVALTRFEELVVEDLPERIRDYKSSHVVVVADDPSELVPLVEVEKRYIERVLEAVGGNKRQAARILGLDRATLYRKLDRYGLSADRRSSRPLVAATPLSAPSAPSSSESKSES